MLNALVFVVALFYIAIMKASQSILHNCFGYTRSSLLTISGAKSSIYYYYSVLKKSLLSPLILQMIILVSVILLLPTNSFVHLSLNSGLDAVILLLLIATFHFHINSKEMGEDILHKQFIIYLVFLYLNLKIGYETSSLEEIIFKQTGGKSYLGALGVTKFPIEFFVSLLFLQEFDTNGLRMIKQSVVTRSEIIKNSILYLFKIALIGFYVVVFWGGFNMGENLLEIFSHNTSVTFFVQIFIFILKAIFIQLVLTAISFISTRKSPLILKKYVIGKLNILLLISLGVRLVFYVSA